MDLEFNYDETTAAMDKFSQKDIDELRAWAQSLDRSKLVPKDLSDKQLVLFYNSCYGEMDKTKECIEKYYMCRKNIPEFFDNRVLVGNLKTASEVMELIVLPGKSVEGYDIILQRIYDTDTSKFHLDSIYQLLFMTVDLYLAKQGPQKGFIFLFDCVGFKFGHLMKISISTIRNFLTYVQGAMPVRMQGVHILNTQSLVNTVMSIAKPFMDRKFYHMINFYYKNDDIEKLYEFIPRSSLPADYGGFLPDAQTLHKTCMEQVKLLEPYFKAEEKQRLLAIPDQKNSH